MMNLFTVKAKHVMEPDVVSLRTLTPVETALGTLEEYGIHGAPVLDEADQLVGVLSATDITRHEHEREEEREGERPIYYQTDPLEEEVHFSGEDYSAELLGRELVGDWMTPEVISVGPDASLAEVCSLMVNRQVHRVFVVEDRKLRGVISTFDIVRRIAREVGVGSGQ